MARSIQDNSFARIMEVVRASEYYNKDLTEQDVLEGALTGSRRLFMLCLLQKAETRWVNSPFFPMDMG